MGKTMRHISGDGREQNGGVHVGPPGRFNATRGIFKDEALAGSNAKTVRGREEQIRFRFTSQHIYRPHHSLEVLGQSRFAQDKLNIVLTGGGRHSQGDAQAGGFVQESD